MISKCQRLIYSGCFVALMPLAGCVTTNQPQTTECSITIRSEPKGALVLASSSNAVKETEATVMGKTPLRRFMKIPKEGMALSVSACGYKEWKGSVSPADPTVLAQLRKVSRNATSGKRLQGVKVIPVRVGAHVVGQRSSALDNDRESVQYCSLFLDAFRDTLQEQGTACTTEGDLPVAQYSEIWAAVEQHLKEHCFERIPYLPKPLKLDLEHLGLGRGNTSDKYILLLRAEAYYISGGKRLTRIAVPLIMTAAGVAIGVNNPVASNELGMVTTTTYAYPVFGVGPQEDSIVIQEVLIHPATGGIEWCGQLVARAYYRKPEAVRQLAQQAAQLIPDEFIK